jgi:hypothetical protein
VEFGGDGDVHTTATVVRREQIRAERRRRMRRHSVDAPAPSVSSGADGQWGPALQLWSAAGGLIAWCAHCGTVLGEFSSG